jgi:lipopolysaccharide transport system permease protein
MSQAMREIVYTSEPQLRHPRQILRRMRADLRQARRLAWRLFVRNITSQYRQSILGYVWLIVPPFVVAGIWMFLNGTNILSVGETAVPYPVFVLVGAVLWTTFVEALNSPLRHFSEARSMLTKIQIPSEAVVLAGAGELLFNLAVRLVAVLIVCLAIGFVPPWTVVLSPLPMLALLVLGVALGLVLAPFGLLYDDVQRGLGVVTTFWFFVTPVVYPVPMRGVGEWMTYLNPVNPLLSAGRDLFALGAVQTPGMAAAAAVFAFAVLAAGWILFLLALPHVIVRLGNR